MYFPNEQLMMKRSINLEKNRKERNIEENIEQRRGGRRSRRNLSPLGLLLHGIEREMMLLLLHRNRDGERGGDLVTPCSCFSHTEAEREDRE